MSEGVSDGVGGSQVLRAEGRGGCSYATDEARRGPWSLVVDHNIRTQDGPGCPVLKRLLGTRIAGRQVIWMKSPSGVLSLSILTQSFLITHDSEQLLQHDPRLRRAGVL